MVNYLKSWNNDRPTLRLDKVSALSVIITNHRLHTFDNTEVASASWLNSSRCICCTMTFGVFGSYGELFLKQGRPYFHLRGCAILCIATYRVNRTGEELRTRTVTRSVPTPFALRHAEKVVLNEVSLIEKKDNW